MFRKSAYLIQGSFFQWEGGDWDIFTPGIGGTKKGYPFKAIVFVGMWRIAGAMTDAWGKSELSDIFMRENEFAFNKVYQNKDPDRSHPIYYHFIKGGRDGLSVLWEGEYSGKSSGGGSAECRIEKIPRDKAFKTMLREIRFGSFSLG